MSVANPWLAVPLADYEGHMNSPGVEQLQPLASIFGEVLAECRPASVVVLGIAGGNGLEKIDPEVTARVAGIDIHPEYLERTRVRYGELAGLELYQCDLASGPLPEGLRGQGFDVVHGALIFEHAGAERCLENALKLVKNPDGVLSVVLQLPALEAGGAGAPVAATPFVSIQGLKSHFALIGPDELTGALRERGWRLVRSGTHAVASGKGFWAALFRRA